MDENQFDFFITAQELGKALGVTGQAIHKFCNENNINKKSNGKIDKIYPEAVNQILSLKKISKGKRPIKCAFHTVKGGAGKTTLCHAIATRAVCYGFKTLVIDLDKQANLTLSFTLNPRQDDLYNFLDLYDDQRNHLDIDYDKFVIELNPDLHIIPANLKLANLDLILQLNSTNIGDIVPRLIGDIEDQYDLICFDLSCDFNRVTMAAHSYVDRVIIPTDPEEYGVFGVDLTYDHVAQVTREWRNSPQKLIVLNKFNASHTSSYELISSLKEKYGDEVCEAVVSTSRPLSDSIGKRRSLWTQSRKRIPALDGLDEISKIILGVGNWKEKRKSRRSSNSLEINEIQ